MRYLENVHSDVGFVEQHKKRRGKKRKRKGRRRSWGGGGKDRNPNRPSEQAEYIPKVDLILGYYLGH